MEETQVQCNEINSPSVNRSSRGRRKRRSSGSSSFEFCSLWKPNLLSADQLFSDGFLLPLHRLRLTSDDDPPEHNPLSTAEKHQRLTSDADPPEHNPLSVAEKPQLAPKPNQPPDSSMAEKLELGLEPNQPDSSMAEKTESGHESNQKPESSEAERPEIGPETGPEISAAISSVAAAIFGSSKRWREIFKRKTANAGENISEEAKKDKKNGIFGATGLITAERVLKINIWPFRKTKSATVDGGAGGRKVSSPPCSTAKKSPERSNPVWPGRRSCGGGGGNRSLDKYLKKDRNYVDRGFRKEGNKGWRKVSPAAADGSGAGDWHKARVLAMNSGDSPDGGEIPGEGVRVSVNLRYLFTKKL